MKKYVCVLATNDYLDGCLVLNENLKQIYSKYSLLCLINKDINQETKDILDYFNIEYKLIKKINYEVDYGDFVQPYFKNTFDKLSIFKLTEYDKLVYLDLDLLILENIDELFNYETPAIAKDYPFSDLYNSGVMVIKPNEDDYNRLITIMNEKMKNNEKLGDQDIINAGFKHINTLPQEYNCMRMIYSNLVNITFPGSDEMISAHPVKNYDTGKKKILHYIVTNKPFNVKHPYLEEYYDLYKDYLDTIKKKKEEYKDKEKELI